jgi:hypothetical protein
MDAAKFFSCSEVIAAVQPLANGRSVGTDRSGDATLFSKLGYGLLHIRVRGHYCYDREISEPFQQRLSIALVTRGIKCLTNGRECVTGTHGRFSMPDMRSARIRRRSWNLRGLLCKVGILNDEVYVRFAPEAAFRKL